MNDLKMMRQVQENKTQELLQKVENLVDENKELKEIIELKNRDIKELEKSDKVKKETVVKLT